MPTSYAWSPWEEILPNRNIAKNRLTDGSLRSVGADDTLYIVAHHASGLDKIVSARGDEMSVSQLCKAIDEAKLSRAVKRIKLWVCEAGKELSEGRGSGFAYDFWSKMKNEYGFTSLTVFAYTGITMDPLPNETNKRCVDTRVLEDSEVQGLIANGTLKPKAARPAAAAQPEDYDVVEITLFPGTAKHYRVGIDPGGNLVGPTKAPPAQAGPPRKVYTGRKIGMVVPPP